MKNKAIKLGWNVFSLYLIVLVWATPVFAQENTELLPPPLGTQPVTEQVTQKTVQEVDAISQSEMEALFNEARQNLQNAEPTNLSSESTQASPENIPSINTSDAVPDVGNQVQITTSAQTQSGGRVALPDVKLRLAYQNMTIEEIMQEVVKEVNRQSGSWKLQWRLTEQNRKLIEQKVNINAESKFDEFLAHLIAKVNNLTGVRLFVKVFEVSRIIIIADTF